MKNLATLLIEVREANKNMAKFIKKGNDKAALMWAEKVEELENQIQLV